MLEDGIPVAEIARWLGRSARYLREGLQARGRRTGTRWRSTARRHGKRLYGFWVHLRRKCEAPGHRDYARFGERGIRVCRAWHDFDAFYDWAMGAGYASGRRLERRSEARDFAPSNCRWVDAREYVARHPPPATNEYPIRAFGERKGQCAWARDPRCRVKQPALRDRLAAGWPPEEAIASPPGAPASPRSGGTSRRSSPGPGPPARARACGSRSSRGGASTRRRTASGCRARRRREGGSRARERVERAVGSAGPSRAARIPSSRRSAATSGTSSGSHSPALSRS
jgi:hypothetical protein